MYIDPTLDLEETRKTHIHIQLTLGLFSTSLAPLTLHIFAASFQPTRKDSDGTRSRDLDTRPIARLTTTIGFYFPGEIVFPLKSGKAESDRKAKEEARAMKEENRRTDQGQSQGR